MVARGSTLTIRLVRPDGGLVAALAGGASCAVPRGTPVVAGGIDNIRSHFSRDVARKAVKRLIALANGNGIPKAA